MNPTGKSFPNGAGASYNNGEMKTFDMEHPMAETYCRWSDLDQVPEGKISLEHYNSELDLLLAIAAPAFLNTITETCKPEDSVIFTEILKISLNDSSIYNEKVHFLIGHARTQYSELENTAYIRAYFRLLKKELNALVHDMTQETMASIRAIAVTKSNVASGKIPAMEKMCKFCRSTGHVKRYCPILNNSGNKYQEP